MHMNQHTEPDLYNLKDIKNHAEHSVFSGAVTDEYPLDLKKTHRLLNEALAGEIMCTLRYRHHQIIAKGINYPQVAAEFKEHAESESLHMMMIAERIDQLGGDPDFNPKSIAERAPTDYGAASGASLTTLIREDLVAERMAIDIYRKLIEYFGLADPTSRRLIEQILSDEEEHASDLADLLVKVQ